jgi:hypothetical protein
MEFKLTITLGNDAMQEPEDVAGALRNVVDKLESGETGEASILDLNGNKVGSWEITE